MSEEITDNDPMITYAGMSDIGMVRSNNEDSWSVDDELGCFIVSDGMGGALAGEVASSMVATLLPAFLKEVLPEDIEDLASEEIRNLIFKALSLVNDSVCKKSADDPDCSGMGATVVMMLVRGTQGLVVHAGDSRAYLVRDGVLSRLTKDHNMLQILLDEGAIKPEDALGHPSGCELLCDVGMPDGMYADIIYFDLEKGDKVLMCTDGLNGMIVDDEITHIINSNECIEEACRKLVEAANGAGGHDNITSLLINYI